MSARLVMAVVIGTGLFMGKLALVDNVGIGGAFAGKSTGDAVRGAQDVMLEAGDTAAIQPRMIDHIVWSHPKIAETLQAVGLQVGPDPSVGTDLAALRARTERDGNGFSLQALFNGEFFSEAPSMSELITFSDGPSVGFGSSGTRDVGYGSRDYLSRPSRGSGVGYGSRDYMSSSGSRSDVGY